MTSHFSKKWQCLQRLVIMGIFFRNRDFHFKIRFSNKLWVLTTFIGFRPNMTKFWSLKKSKKSEKHFFKIFLVPFEPLCCVCHFETSTWSLTWKMCKRTRIVYFLLKISLALSVTCTGGSLMKAHKFHSPRSFQY